MIVDTFPTYLRKSVHDHETEGWPGGIEPLEAGVRDGSQGTATAWITTGPRVGSSSVA
jgi:hypothetical protein